MASNTNDAGDGDGRSRDSAGCERKEEGPLIVAIGASAGGLAALKELLAMMPADTGTAFVIVVHLSPDRESHLADLLQPGCAMPVRQVRETMPLEPDCVYVIPPNANLNAIDTHLRLSDLEVSRRERAPIDHFFRTLAETHDGNSVGVVLTGTGTDGTLGLRWIKEGGGLTIAQSPEEAEFDGMPRSAIASGFVDLVLPLEAMPREIARLCKAESRLRQIRSVEGANREQERQLHRILSRVHDTVGHDFSRYKQSTIRRRIARRMHLCGVDRLGDYDAVLQEQPAEVVKLFEDLLITVTEFFRDEDVYSFLASDVIPELFEQTSAAGRIRVWSAGCATGEEAYSLAILLLEEAARRGGVGRRSRSLRAICMVDRCSGRGRGCIRIRSPRR